MNENILYTHCVVCGKEIENPRVGKKYCSQNCCQRDYRRRKKQSLLNESQSNIPEPVQSPEIIKAALKFSFEEYENVKKALGENIQLVDYCFYRKNITGSPSIDFIVKFIKEKKEEFNPYSPLPGDEERSKEYSKFLGLYDSPYVLIIPPESDEKIEKNSDPEPKQED